VTGVFAITVDVDGVAGLPDGGRDYAHRLSSRTERTYGVTRGLPRILRILGAHAVRATFYVPGVTALEHPDAIHSIVDAGHELAHHGHTHRRPDLLSEADQRAEIEHGLDALATFGVRPLGYRAPGWELTPFTLGLLADYGFVYDSSLMGDDRPHRLGSLVELPVHWSLDDAPYFATSPFGAGLWDVWRGELELAAVEERTITLTLHPDILGRGQRAGVLRQVLELAHSLGLRPATHGELVTRFRPPTPKRERRARGPAAPS
jgi:peptidoglycan/xylan/chitin deacetylase (PgdA/CDA1 family)